MTEIYLIRHAQAEGNVYRMMQGHWDGKITSTGRLQIAALAERLRDINIDALYSSDLSRTVETAGAVTKYHPLPIQTDPRLRELNMGVWEQEFFGNLRHYDPIHVGVFTNDPSSWQTEGSENYMQVTERAVAALTQIAAGNDGKTVTVVSHGVTCRCILSRLLNAPFVGEGGVPIFTNTAVSHIFYENGRFTVDYFNDASHLEGLSLEQWGRGDCVWDAPFDVCRDEDYYKSCYARAWKLVHGSLDDFSAEPFFRCAAKHTLTDSRAVLRFYCEDESVGILDLDPVRGENCGYGWISLIYLEEEYRHRGIGIQMLARAFKFYLDKGRKAIRLHVNAANPDAVEFYKKWGFKVLSRDGGSAENILLMERKLGENGCL